MQSEQKQNFRLILAVFDYFINASRYKIVVDQIQSEQSSRFLGKRNRNIIIELDEKDDIEVLDSHDWMTLPQIKELMRENNLVNMDTRTVLSCLPFSIYLSNVSVLFEILLHRTSAQKANDHGSSSVSRR